jgi:3-oxoacyl-[acyl-carrier protein] reductase
MSEGEFAGRTALVTGGSRGIGRAICLGLARGGARVAVNYAASADAAEAVRREIEQGGGAAITVAADVSDPQETQAAVEATEAAFGPVDLLVCNAAIMSVENHTEMTYESWRRTMAVNVDGVFNPVMAVKDGMIERGDGRIVCLSSIAALRPRPGVIAYATSKAAVIAFVRSCSEAFAPRVRINAVAPGLVETEMSQTLDPVARQAMIEATPLKRIGQPDEIAELVLFLLSDRASYTTGQTYVASGGRATLP